MNGYRLTDQKIVWPLGDDVTFNRTDPRTYITRSSGDAYVVGFSSTFLSQLSDNLESQSFLCKLHENDSQEKGKLYKM